MTIATSVTMRTVLEQFLFDEATNQQYAEALSDLAAWTHLPDEAFFRRVREFAKLRRDVNPVLTFTIGTQANRHHERVLGWEMEMIEVSELYSCGLNICMKKDLDQVNGNVLAFAKNYAAKYAEFRLNETPVQKRQRVIAVRHPTAGRQGTMQLLDGAHRVVALAVQGVKVVSGYVAVLKTSPAG